jgi:DNA-binding response OmpR family regulator
MKKRIVVVDDDPDLVDLLAEGLSLYGSYEITACSDSESGLEEVINNRPDCVIVDIMMPQVNGFQFVSAIRGDRSTEHIPLVILSALTQKRSQIQGMLRGADAYLTKPVEFSVLVNAIDHAITLTAQQRRQQRISLSQQEDMETNQ